MRFKPFFVMMVIGLSLGVFPAGAQGTQKPFILPVALPSGASTWLMGQPYGNTTGAYNFGTAWYSAGQGLHFGIDISMPCGTPLVAVADGEVIYVDNLSFGAGPHNLILRHSDAGVTTLYGHLLDKPPLAQFQTVRQGQLVGYSGDPDITCDSRPHLHLEVRALDYRTAYNPIVYIDAPWDMLVSIGPFNNPMFQQDLTNTRQWITLYDQPAVAFGGARLNAYQHSWPPPNSERPPANPRILVETTPLSAESRWEFRPMGYEGCCAAPWWHPTDSNHLYTVDGTPGQMATITQWDVAAAAPSAFMGQAPPPVLSPDGTHQINRAGGQVSIRRLADGAEWLVETRGNLPGISADNTRLLWLARSGASVPGGASPQVEVWVSDIDGANPRQLYNQRDISARWIDGHRLLISTSQRTLTTLSIHDTRDDATYTLGSWDRLRGMSIAPGGGRLMFYQTFQQDTTQNGIYTIETQPGAQAIRMNWFGGWRWRDPDSVYYIPFDPTTNLQTLAYYHIPSGENRLLTDPAAQPFTALNGDWAVSPDGRHIVFQNAADQRLWLLEDAS